MQRLGIRRNMPGRKPVWKFTKKTGKLVRDSQGDIDWYRYQQEVLIPKLIPFALECKKTRPDTIIQEDGAPAHLYHAQAEIFSAAEIARLFWPANSPDLNMIEPGWFWMKEKTTEDDAQLKRPEMIKSWKQTWKDMEQSRIQAWIERIPVHIQRVLVLKGDNNYIEGRDHTRRRRPHPLKPTS